MSQDSNVLHSMAICPRQSSPHTIIILMIPNLNLLTQFCSPYYLLIEKSIVCYLVAILCHPDLIHLLGMTNIPRKILSP